MESGRKGTQFDESYALFTGQHNLKSTANDVIQGLKPYFVRLLREGLIERKEYDDLIKVTKPEDFFSEKYAKVLNLTPPFSNFWELLVCFDIGYHYLFLYFQNFLPFITPETINNPNTDGGVAARIFSTNQKHFFSFTNRQMDAWFKYFFDHVNAATLNGIYKENVSQSSFLRILCFNPYFFEIWLLRDKKRLLGMISRDAFNHRFIFSSKILDMSLPEKMQNAATGTFVGLHNKSPAEALINNEKGRNLILKTAPELLDLMNAETQIIFTKEIMHSLDGLNFIAKRMFLYEQLTEEDRGYIRAFLGKKTSDTKSEMLRKKLLVDFNTAESKIKVPKVSEPARPLTQEEMEANRDWVEKKAAADRQSAKLEKKTLTDLITSLIGDNPQITQTTSANEFTFTAKQKQTEETLETQQLFTALNNARKKLKDKESIKLEIRHLDKGIRTCVVRGEASNLLLFFTQALKEQANLQHQEKHKNIKLFDSGASESKQEEIALNPEEVEAWKKCLRLVLPDGEKLEWISSEKCFRLKYPVFNGTENIFFIDNRKGNKYSYAPHNTEEFISDFLKQLKKSIPGFTDDCQLSYELDNGALTLKISPKMVTPNRQKYVDYNAEITSLLMLIKGQQESDVPLQAGPETYSEEVSGYEQTPSINPVVEMKNFLYALAAPEFIAPNNPLKLLNDGKVENGEWVFRVNLKQFHSIGNLDTKKFLAHLKLSVNNDKRFIDTINIQIDEKKQILTLRVNPEKLTAAREAIQGLRTTFLNQSLASDFSTLNLQELGRRIEASPTPEQKQINADALILEVAQTISKLNPEERQILMII